MEEEAIEDSDDSFTFDLLFYLFIPIQQGFARLFDFGTFVRTFRDRFMLSMIYLVSV